MHGLRTEIGSFNTGLHWMEKLDRTCVIAA